MSCMCHRMRPCAVRVRHHLVPHVDVRVCVLTCVLSYGVSADSVSVTVAILVLLAILLGLTLVVFLKRKSVLHFLFAKKNNSMWKLR